MIAHCQGILLDVVLVLLPVIIWEIQFALSVPVEFDVSVVGEALAIRYSLLEALKRRV